VSRLAWFAVYEPIGVSRAAIRVITVEGGAERRER
jgi:hypothetical protein